MCSIVRLIGLCVWVSFNLSVEIGLQSCCLWGSAALTAAADPSQGRFRVKDGVQLLIRLEVFAAIENILLQT